MYHRLSMDILDYPHIWLSMDIGVIHGLSADYPYKIIYPRILSEMIKWVSAICYPYGYMDNEYMDPNTTENK